MREPLTKLEREAWNLACNRGEALQCWKSAHDQARKALVLGDIDAVRRYLDSERDYLETEKGEST